MSNRETIHKDLKGEIGSVDNRVADSAVASDKFQLIEGIIPWQGEHRRVFGKRPMGKMFGVINDNLAVITINSIPGNHIIYQTREGLMMDDNLTGETSSWSVRSGITDFATLQKIDRLVRQLKTAGLWEKMIALYPFAGQTALAHAQNLISSSHTITWNGGVTHDAAGSHRTGAPAGYGDSNVNMNILNLMDVHMSCYMTGTSVSTDLMGAYDNGTAGGSILQIEPGAVQNAPTAFTVDCNLLAEGRMVGVSPVRSTSHTILTRRSNIDAEAYSEGISFATRVALSSNNNFSCNIYLLCRSTMNSPVGPVDPTANMSLASIGYGLTTAQALDFYNIVQAFQTSMGRQV